MDADRILTSLNNAGITKKQPALYQAIKFLISATRANQEAVSVIVAGSSGGGGGGGGGGATINGTYLTATDESASLVFSRELLAGTNITFDDTTPNQRTINASGSSGGSDYVVASDGATPVPSPVNDGFGNFVYITYTP